MKILNIPELKFLKIAIQKNPKNNSNLEYLEKEDAVACLLLDKTERKILLVNQYRAGAKKNIFEIPAGLIEENENPLQSMFRELREETGYDKEDCEIIYSSDGFLVSPGCSTEKIFIFILKLKSNNIIPKELKLDENEDLTCKWFDLDDILNITNDMKTCLALNIYKNLKK